MNLSSLAYVLRLKPASLLAAYQPVQQDAGLQAKWERVSRWDMNNLALLSRGGINGFAFLPLNAVV